METQIIDGNRIASELYVDYRRKIEGLFSTYDRAPGLAVILVEGDQASQVYVNRIIKKCTEIGLKADLFAFSGDVETVTLVEKVIELNKSSVYDGIIVQFPLPKNLDEQQVREAISPLKDVDAAGSSNIGKFYTGSKSFIACTPKGMYHLLKGLNQPLSGKHGVVIGRSHVVGKPIADLLLRENMTVTVCHSKTQHLESITKQADVIMLGVGRAKLLTKEMVKSGAIIIDAGINVVDGKLVGDADYLDLLGEVSYMTPVPGGVGPMTIAMLVENVIEAFETSCV